MIAWKTETEKNLMRQALEQGQKECYVNGSILASTDDIVPSLCVIWLCFRIMVVQVDL